MKRNRPLSDVYLTTTSLPSIDIVWFTAITLLDLMLLVRFLVGIGSAQETFNWSYFLWNTIGLAAALLMYYRVNGWRKTQSP